MAKTPKIPDFVVISLLRLLELSEGVLVTNKKTISKLIDIFIALPNRNIFLSKLANVLIKCKSMRNASILVDLAKKCLNLAKQNRLNLAKTMRDYGIIGVIEQIYHSFHLFNCEKIKPLLCGVYVNEMADLLKTGNIDFYEKWFEEFRGVFYVICDYLHERTGLFGQDVLEEIINLFGLVSEANKVEI